MSPRRRAWLEGGYMAFSVEHLLFVQQESNPDRLTVASCTGLYVDWLHVGRPAHSEGKWLPVEPLWPISLPSGSWDCIKVRKVLMRKRQSEYLLLAVYLLDAQDPDRKWVREEVWAEQPGSLQAGNWAHTLELAGPVFKSTHSTSPSKLSPVISDPAPLCANLFCF